MERIKQGGEGGQWWEKTTKMGLWDVALMEEAGHKGIVQGFSSLVCLHTHTEKSHIVFLYFKVS